MPVNLPQFNFGGPNPLGDTYYGTPDTIEGPESEPGFTDRLRMSSIFGDGGDSDPNMQAMPQTESLMALLGEQPESQGPGMLKKIAASMIALNDPRLSMELLQQPDQALVDWQNQVDAAQQAAEAEQTMRDFQDIAVGRGLEGKRAETASARLTLDELKQQNPQMQVVKTEGGNYMLINRTTGETKDSGIAVGTLTPEDEAELKIETETTLIGKRAAAARKTTKMGQERGAEIAKTGREHGAGLAEAGREHAAGIAREKATSPKTETGAAQKKRIQDALNKPENKELRKWFEITGSGVRIKDVDEVDKPFNFPFLGKNREELDAPIELERQEAYELLYGAEDTVTGPIETEGKIRVRAPDGVEGNWPADKPIPEGFTRVQ